MKYLMCFNIWNLPFLIFFLQLEELKLSDKPIRIRGTYTNSDAPGLPPRVNVEYNALHK